MVVFFFSIFDENSFDTEFPSVDSSNSLSTLPEVGWSSEASLFVFISLFSFEVIIFSFLWLAEGEEATVVLVLVVDGEAGGGPHSRAGWGDDMVRSGENKEITKLTLITPGIPTLEACAYFPIEWGDFSPGHNYSSHLNILSFLSGFSREKNMKSANTDDYFCKYY